MVTGASHDLIISRDKHPTSLIKMISKMTSFKTTIFVLALYFQFFSSSIQKRYVCKKAYTQPKEWKELVYCKSSDDERYKCTSDSCHKPDFGPCYAPTKGLNGFYTANYHILIEDFKMQAFRLKHDKDLVEAFKEPIPVNRDPTSPPDAICDNEFLNA
ncbi:hypothetical protein O181_003035, partial [Austropuccinia psidii MF-1]|nr:hypothetical protein [Austropuccinia psidii MF-1]